MKLYYFFIWILLCNINCTKAPPQNDPIPTHESFKIQSAQVNEERTINIWLPPNYKPSDSFPVMYMADGGIKEDFPHIANTLAQLTKEKKIKPLILVGIENTQRRRDLTGFTTVATDKEVAPIVGGSEKFRDFIKLELIPEIDKRYSTTGERSIIGESLSGLFVMETFFLTPDLFDYYIAFDPSLWWNNHYLVTKAKDYLNKFPNKRKQLWFAGSNASDISPYTQELSRILNHEKLPLLRWHYSDEPTEKHSTIFRATKEKAFIWAFSNSESK
ncbi:alpha/beta hydrolase [Elizabethkingia sp. JS20170427COW]|uniref:alpha/beta hydrolase n=1 Tax=Elizabethkingia sp. JS20170427COW TaxID=2583851 RepID=UPI001110087A|nr:alpha/beta hydrolase-fold protein [Elizabethkingia sp. JS20170427COW]QCX52318.1 alpha/beta hydrolase [Elizabethkingia sp. JS20170427COW]